MLAVAAASSVGGAAQAGLTAVLPRPASILPADVGVGIGTRDGVTLAFAHDMDHASVEAALTITPAHALRLTWLDDGRRELLVAPEGLWSTDQRYLLVVGTSARAASGAQLGGPMSFSFTTQTAPRIDEFGVRYAAEPPAASAALRMAGLDAGAPPPDVASGVSARTAIRIGFSAPMNRSEVEGAFLLSPAVPGIFSWTGSVMTFTPIERLASGARYGVSLAGVHDSAGNPLGGDSSFSFTTQSGAQVVQSAPTQGATRVRAKEIVLWFSQPVNPIAVGAALQVRDRSTGGQLTGSVAWNGSTTQLHFTPARAFAAGHRIDVSLAQGAVDADGNAVTASLTFTTRSAARPAIAGPAPSATLVGYALNQINAARAAYGLKPLVYSKAIEAVALAHAWDQMNYNYFGHTGRDGLGHEDRLRRAGLVFGWNGENLCMNNNSGRTTTGTLNWCQAQFMSEPYPGVANHIGNILGTHYTRVGVGIAIKGAKVIIVWDFTD